MMSKALSAFSMVFEHSDLWVASKRDLRCTALRLRDGSLCLYSPVQGLGEIARESLASLGDVSILLAPNHYHNKGLTEYAMTFPEADLICSDRARPRLEELTGLTFEGLEELEQMLPENWKIGLPDGLKTGEVWLIRETLDAPTWIVCDAFKGASGSAGCVSSKVETLGTFPRFGIKDSEAYATWVENMLKDKSPATVVPCHGSIVRSESLRPDIEALLR